MRLAGRRLITALTLTAAAAAGGALATSAEARASRPACSAPAAHRGHRSHACSRSRHTQTTRPHAKAREHSHPGAKGATGAHRGKRETAAKRSATKVTRKTTRKAKRKATASPAKAACEDGSAPARTGTDSFTCKDGSEPGCESGSFPIVASNGATLLCNSPAGKGGGGSSPPHLQSEAEEAVEAVCEDGTSPSLHGGALACDDGSEPYCEEGGYLTLASNGTKLQCTAEEAEG